MRPDGNVMMPWRHKCLIVADRMKELGAGPLLWHASLVIDFTS